MPELSRTDGGGVKYRRGIRSALIGLTLALVGGATGCKELNPFDPCPETKKQEKVGQLDGTWDVELVQTDLKTGGLPYKPLVGLPILMEGSLLFQTTNAVKGSSCTELLKTEGIVMATYKYEEAGLSTDIISDWNGGRFVFDHKTEVLTLRAGQATREVDVTTIEGERAIVVVGHARELKKEYELLGSISIIFSKRPF